MDTESPPLQETPRAEGRGRGVGRGRGRTRWEERNNIGSSTSVDGTDRGKPLHIHVLCVRYNTQCILCIQIKNLSIKRGEI